ncbi:dTDP-4-dehydrorhamnose reductase [Arachidicoccus terrestris]|uniref:dTDP-4-dehydrorhamnose reductase n=1 Tax=Arachidicoccus terrestris TaxID=2875539 RepID=UPI001CC80077|nr:dTDP-4-dehydrorhamnose reductase [Arachidicoccus terrestris]UAY54637.1 dTDP-4-dehydrorhamnose reductase [Arachidicoccus terrestris]
MSALPTIIVTGKNGQLGSELLALHMSYPGYRFVFLDRNQLDFASLKELKALFETYRPDFFINAAAYTAVDKAETDKKLAMEVNGEAVGKIAKACYENGTRLIHISTDYVFDGQAKSPYQPDHCTSPVNFYGESKLKGEQLAMAGNKATIIIRTAWVYSAYGHNFVKTMLRLMSERPSIGVVSDQFGAPTYARDLAVAIMTIIEQGAQRTGIYHFSNAGKISWYDFACAIRDKTGLSCQINPITTADFPTPAKRPAYSVLDTSSLNRDYGVQPRGWQDALQECLGYLQRI